MLDSHPELTVVCILRLGIRIRGHDSVRRTRSGCKVDRAFPDPRNLLERNRLAFFQVGIWFRATPQHCDKGMPEHKKDARQYEYRNPGQDGEICVICVNFGKMIWHRRAHGVLGATQVREAVFGSSPRCWLKLLLLSKLSLLRALQCRASVFVVLRSAVVRQQKMPAQKMCARTEARRYSGRRLSPAANVPKSRLAPLHRQYPKSSLTVRSNPHFWGVRTVHSEPKLGHRPPRSTTLAGLPAMQNGHADARSSRGSESPFKLGASTTPSMIECLRIGRTDASPREIAARRSRRIVHGGRERSLWNQASTGLPVWLGNLDSNQD